MGHKESVKDTARVLGRMFDGIEFRGFEHAKVEELAADYPLDIKVAVMGCAVNGPGEAREADLGVAGGQGEGLLFKKGEIVRKVPEGELLAALKEELDNWVAL